MPKNTDISYNFAHNAELGRFSRSAEQMSPSEKVIPAYTLTNIFCNENVARVAFGVECCCCRECFLQPFAPVFDLTLI